MTPTKACPVVLRRGRSGDELLVFRHPNAGVQLVKGTVERGEGPADAALREFVEETGINDARVIRSLGTWNSDYEKQVWAFFEVGVARALPQEWTHHTNDGGGLKFSFFWHPLSKRPSSEWHWVHVAALEYVATHVSPSEKSVVPAG